MPVANRHRRIARKTAAVVGKPVPVQKDYRILDPHFRPDLRGHFGGQSAFKLPDGWHVKLSDAQAKYYLATGVVALSAPSNQLNRNQPSQQPARR